MAIAYAYGDALVTRAEQLERMGRDSQRGHHVGQQIVGSIQERVDEPGIGLGVCTQSLRRTFERAVKHHGSAIRHRMGDRSGGAQPDQTLSLIHI